MRRASLRVVLFLFTFPLAVGCPHRSPVWSPDGAKVLILAGPAGEEIDKAASQLWLADVAGGTARRLVCPGEGVRYLAAGWFDRESFHVATGAWVNDSIKEGSERFWRVGADGSSWKELSLPPPNEARATRRPPLAIRAGGKEALVYPSSGEEVRVVEVETGKDLLKLDPAELVGPGPGGGFLVAAPEANDTGTIEIVAIGPDLKPLWRRKLSAIRDAIAKKAGKAPVEIVFNETTASLPPVKGEEASIGLNLIFSDVGWKDGIPGYHVRLSSASGDVLSFVHSVGLSGLASSAGGALRVVLAPQPRAKVPVRIESLAVETGKSTRGAPLGGLEKEAVRGYASDPDGKRLAVSVNTPGAALWIFADGEVEKPRIIRLEEK
ncbi:MAG TPA: hypothetical protein VMT52_10510 [Planctomycetota bacterium]|nr:hypothetical protein [Planctomycetota bacterium]